MGNLRVKEKEMSKWSFESNENDEAAPDDEGHAQTHNCDEKKNSADEKRAVDARLARQWGSTRRDRLSRGTGDRELKAVGGGQCSGRRDGDQRACRESDDAAGLTSRRPAIRMGKIAKSSWERELVDKCCFYSS